MKSEDLAGEIDCTEIKQLAKQPKKERNQKQNQKQKQVGNWDSPWALSTDIYIVHYGSLSTISDYSRLGITCVALAGRGGVICSLLHTENYEPSLFALKRTQGFVPCRRIK